MFHLMIVLKSLWPATSFRQISPRMVTPNRCTNVFKEHRRKYALLRVDYELAMFQDQPEVPGIDIVRHNNSIKGKFHA